jgi:hypothetical protein
LAELEAETSEPSLRKQIETLENALKETALSESGRESKAATLHILEKRLANLSRGRAVMDEVCSDLQRLEAKVELALENARMGRRTEIIATEIDMNRPFLEDNLSDFTLGAENTEPMKTSDTPHELS